MNFSDTVWGIYAAGGGVSLAPDSIVGFSLKDPSKVSTYIQEDGAFASYNKVQTPYDIRVKASKGGSESDRGDFLGAIADMKQSTDLYDIMTPEITYLNANLEGYDYKRDSRNGVTLVVAELMFTEIRIVAGTGNYNPSVASGADSKSGGQVQTQSNSSLPDASATQ